MTRWLPYPLLAGALFLTWLLLAEAVSPGQFLLACLVALVGTWTMTTLEPVKSRLCRPRAILRLIGVVTADIIRSNIAVARIILRRERRRTSGFMTIPLDLRDLNGLAVLACIVTATPGTIWVNYDRSSGKLLLHILDLIDEAAWIAIIKGRYERLLLEIFE